MANTLLFPPALFFGSFQNYVRRFNSYQRFLKYSYGSRDNTMDRTAFSEMPFKFFFNGMGVLSPSAVLKINLKLWIINFFHGFWQHVSVVYVKQKYLALQLHVWASLDCWLSEFTTAVIGDFKMCTSQYWPCTILLLKSVSA